MIKKIIYGGRVVANNDPWMIGRVRIFPDDEVIQQILDSKKGEYDSQGVSILNDNQSDIRDVYQFTSKDPFVYLPLLPINLSILPEINEYVNIIYSNKEENTGRKNQYYVASTKSTVMNIQFENNSATKSILAEGANIQQNLPIKNFDGTYPNSKSKGVFAESQDIGIYSKGRSDIILKDGEVLIRAVKTTELEQTRRPQVNQKRTFLQLSYFDKKLSFLPEKTLQIPFLVDNNIKKLLEYDVININNASQGNYTGSIKIYNLPPIDLTKVSVFNQDTSLPATVTTPAYIDEFINLSEVELVLRINNAIGGLNKGKVDGYNKPDYFATDGQRFPFYYRPGINLKTALQNPIVSSSYINASSIINKIKFVGSTLNKGYDLVSAENRTGRITDYSKVVTQDVQVSPIQEGYAVLGGDNIYFLSHNSSIPGKKPLNLSDDTVYGIPVDELSLNYIKNTSGIVRGDQLQELLNLIIRYLLSHTHPWHNLPADETPYAGEAISKSMITSEFALFDSKVINQNIRTN
jgi:hypothetical protein